MTFPCHKQVQIPHQCLTKLRIYVSFSLCGFLVSCLVSCFSSKKCVFIIFISFFDEVSNFRNRMLTIQKPELVIGNHVPNQIKANDCSSTHTGAIKFIEGIPCEGFLMIILNEQINERNLYLFS